MKTEATTKALKQYIYELDHMATRLTQGHEMSVCDELSGVIEDERHYNKEADHVISDVLQALIYEIRGLNVKQQIEQLNIIKRAFEQLVVKYRQQQSRLY